MTQPVDPGYEWLDYGAGYPGEGLMVASLFAFYDGVDTNQVVRLSGMTEPTAHDLSTDPDPWEQAREVDEGLAAVFSLGKWTVLYQDNGYPQQVAESIAAAPGVARSVIVYWNVNALISFGLWEAGSQVDGFSEWPSLRVGADQDRLTADMLVVGLLPDDEVSGIYQRMLALADRITGEHLSPTFLSHPHVVLGSISLD